MHDFQRQRGEPLAIQPLLQDFPPPAQASPVIQAEILKMMQQSPQTFQSDLAYLREQAWIAYSNQDNRQVHYTVNHYHFENCWNDNSDHSDRSQRTTTTTTHSFELPEGLRTVFLLMIMASVLVLIGRGYERGFVDAHQQQWEVQP